MAVRPSVTKPGRGGSQPTAVIPVNIQRVERLILDNRRITCRETARDESFCGYGEHNHSLTFAFWKSQRTLRTKTAFHF